PCKTRNLACPYAVFFFQAEDGIRDFHVTGVQTCALPISLLSTEQEERKLFILNIKAMNSSNLNFNKHIQETHEYLNQLAKDLGRSEERRVGKEWRSRRAADHLTTGKHYKSSSSRKIKAEQ